MFTSGAMREAIVAKHADEALHVAPIDLKHLRRYTLGDVELEREVMQLFFAQVPKTIAGLADALNDHEWRIAAHTIKGSARAVGAWQIARLAEQAERLTGLKNRASQAEIILRIEDGVREAEAFIAQAYAR